MGLLGVVGRRILSELGFMGLLGIMGWNIIFFFEKSIDETL